MRIYIDCDDVVAETGAHLLRVLSRHRATVPRFEDIRAFDLHVSLSLNAEEYDAFMEEVHQDEELLAMDPFPGAADTLRAWIAEGHEPVVVTGRPPYSGPATREWLDRLGLRDVGLLHVDKYGRFRGEPPAGVRVLPFSRLSELGFGLAVDDSPLALDLLESSGLCPYVVFDRPWNRTSHPSAPRVRGWAELAEFVSAFPGGR